MDLSLGHVGVLEDLFYGRNALLEEGKAEFFELGSGDDEHEIFGFSEGIDFNGGLSGRRKNTLSTFALSTETSHGSWIVSNVDVLLLEEVSSAEFDELVIEIFTTKMGVTSSSLDFEDTVVESKEGDIESTTTEIEDEHVLFTLTLLVKTVSNSGSSGLVDDSEHIETSDGTGVLGSLSLGVIEVSRHSDDCVLDGAGQESFSDFSHLDENHGRDFFSMELLDFTLVLDDDLGLVIGTRLNLEGPELDVLLDNGFIELTTNESLSIEDSVDGVSGSLVLSGITDKSFGFSESNIRRGGSVTLIVCNNFDSVVDEDTNAGVSSAQIDTDSEASFDFLISHFVLMNLFSF